MFSYLKNKWFGRPLKNPIKQMNPTIGRVVIYNASESNRQKQEVEKHSPVGCNVQEQLPAIITAVWSETTVNLKVIHDGNGESWETSVQQGDEAGQWNWPVIKKDKEE